MDVERQPLSRVEARTTAGARTRSRAREIPWSSIPTSGPGDAELVLSAQDHSVPRGDTRFDATVSVLVAASQVSASRRIDDRPGRWFRRSSTVALPYESALSGDA